MSSIPESLILDKLKTVFKHERFRSKEQKEAVKCVVGGKNDVYVSMPTGSGKSLVYQLPAVVAGSTKVTIVVSPLIALIKDQMEHLQKFKIVAESINSKMGEKDRKRVLDDLNCKQPNTRMLYVTPEQCATGTFKGIVGRLVKYDKLAHFVIDEAHCVSQWGHDFRPDYLKLGQLRKLTGSGCSWVALTATASDKVVEDIFAALKFKNVKKFKIPSFRKNIFYDIKFVDVIENEVIDLKQFINTSLGQGWELNRGPQAGVGIIYCRSRDGTEQLANQLTKRGVPCLAYHAGLKAGDRSKVQEDWMDGKVAVITATISFGMGVDKSSVRFVVHWNTPQNVASYYQESGRAGRDGKPSWARVYYSARDRDTAHFLIQKEMNKAKTESKKKKLEVGVKSFELMVKYCETANCRHAVFSRYFGDSIPQCVDKCDVCANKKLVEKAIDDFHQNKLKGKNYIAGPLKKFDEASLYGEGRGGQKRAAESYAEGEDDSQGREERAKAELRGVLKKQFKLRRGKTEVELDRNGEDRKKKEQEDAIAFAKVKAAEFTSKKITGLDVRTREDYMGLVESSLADNYRDVKKYGETDRDFQNFDILQGAIEAEYKIFTNNKVVTMYKRGVVKLIQTIKADTKAWKLSQPLADYTKVEQGKTLGQLAKSIEAKNNTLNGTTTNTQDQGSSMSNTNPTKPRGGGFKFKRETMDQKSMKDFFKPKVKEEEFNDHNMDSDEEEGEEKLVIDDVDNTEDYAVPSYQEISNSWKEEKSSNSKLKSANKIIEKFANPNAKKVDLFCDEDEIEVKAEMNADVKAEVKADVKADVKANASAAKLRNYDKLLNNNSGDSSQSDLFNKLEAKISQLSQNMKEGEDQMNYVQSIKEEQKKEAIVKKEKLKETTPKKETLRSQSPEPLEGQKPTKKLTAAELKQYKIKLAEDFIQVLIPFNKTGVITSKPVFKTLARQLTHKVLDSGGQMSRAEIISLTNKFFLKNPGLQTEEEARRAVKKFRI